MQQPDRQSRRKDLVSVGFDKPDKRILECFAIQENRSLADIIRLICKKYISENRLEQKYL